MISKLEVPAYRIETIGISGRKDTNKHLCAELVQASIEEIDRKRRIVKAGFSEPIYGMLISLFSPKLTWEYMQDKSDEIPGLQIDGKPATGRLLMQSFGDYCKSIYPNVFIDRVFKQRIHGYLYILYDVRFPEEAEAILSHNGTVIRIESDGDDNHITETALDNFNFPIVMKCADKKEMKDNIKEIVSALWLKK